MGSDCHGIYVHSTIYETAFGVVVLYRSTCQLEEGWGQSAMGICAFCYI